MGRDQPGPQSLLRQPRPARGKYGHRRQAVLELAISQNDPSIRLAFNTARACHANFYNDWMEQEDLDSYLPDIQHLVETILNAKAE